MTDFLKKLFSSETFGPKLYLFNIYHILLLLIVFGGSLLFAYLTRKKSQETKKKIVDIATLIMIILYFLDFFIHPFMTGEDKLIVDKLPFHLCTGAGILIALSRLFPRQFAKFRTSFAVLGLIGGMMYLTVPTALDDEFILCYRSLQTIIYHGLLFFIGVTAISYDDIKIEYKYIYREAIVLVIMDLISIFANRAYGGIRGDNYDWFFSTGSSFGVSPYLMPFVMFAILFAQCNAIYLINFGVRKLFAKCRAKKQLAQE